MIVYLDSSVVLRVLLDQPEALPEWGRWEAAYSSELLGVECRRVIDRLRLDAVFSDREISMAMEQLEKIESTIRRVRLTRSVVQAASRSMPTVVRTLDAFHLASATLLRERRNIELLFATHDVQQSIAARALGFACLGR